MEKVEIPNEVLIPEIGKLLGEGREVELRPKGNSMLPFIRQGKDSVVLKKKASIAEGDIVLADLGSRFVLHRVIKEEGECLTLMGDGNVKGVEKCRKKDVLGTVVTILRNGKKEVVPSKGKVWRMLLPIRRYLLAFYRRVLM